LRVAISKPHQNNKDTPQKNTIYPAAGTKIEFSAATIVAFKIKQSKNPVTGSSSHRRQMAKVDDGRLIIDKEWIRPK